MSRGLYDRTAAAYAKHRRPDPRIAARIAAALGSCESVVNVGAGLGSYEPKHCAVVAVEPSLEMLRSRPRGAAPAVQGVAGQLPFKDASFAAALAVLTIHHWPDWRAGLAELRRVARERIVILTYDPEHRGFWLVDDYLPQNRVIDRRTFPSLPNLESELGRIEIEALPVPADCADGFLGAYWRRPTEYLTPSVRDAISSFSQFDWRAGIERLRDDLAVGRWHERHGALLELAELDIGYRLVVAHALRRRSA